MVLAKRDLFRAGNEVSERQGDDVARLVKMNRDALDWSYLASLAEGIGVMELLRRLRSFLKACAWVIPRQVWQFPDPLASERRRGHPMGGSELTSSKPVRYVVGGQTAFVSAMVTG